MTLPASDNFNRTDDPTGLGANWTPIRGSPTAQILGNAAAPNIDNVEGGIIWNADTFADDQYAEATISQRGNLSYIGVLVRGTTNNYYLFYTDDAQRYFARIVGGVFTSFSVDSPLAVNDVMRIEAAGDEISCYINGTLWTSLTDTNHASGAAGVSVYDNITSTRLGDWEGGNLNQVIRPTSTVTVSAWTDQASGTTNMHAPLADETDTTYIQSEEDPNSSYVEVALGAIGDPGVNTGHIFRYRYAKEPAISAQINLTVQLRQGASTVIASATHTNISGSIVDGSITLSGTEADSITNYNDLRFRFIGDQV